MKTSFSSANETKWIKLDDMLFQNLYISFVIVCVHFFSKKTYPSNYSFASLYVPPFVLWVYNIGCKHSKFIFLNPPSLPTPIWSINPVRVIFANLSFLWFLHLIIRPSLSFIWTTVIISWQVFLLQILPPSYCQIYFSEFNLFVSLSSLKGLSFPAA